MISKLFLISCSLFLISMSYSATINATKTDANTVYYIANSSNAFEAGYILCDPDTPICHIQCNAEYSCYQTIINATFSDHLTLECNDRYSCKEITVYGPTNSSNVQCNEYWACAFASFQFADTPSVHMLCGGISDSNTYSCYQTDLDVSRSESVDVQCMTPISCGGDINATFVSDSINILCNDGNSCSDNVVYALHANEVNIACNGSQSYSCGGIEVYCPSKNKNQCNVDCGVGGMRSCTQFNVYTADNFTVGFLNVSIHECPSSGSCGSFIVNCMDSGLTTWYYHQIDTPQTRCNDYNCCPISDFKLEPYTQCNDGEDCVINCTLNDPFDNNCRSGNIDASKSTSLTLYCQSRYSCQGLNVLCPFGGDCHVICEGNTPCQSLMINASLSTNTNLTCGAGSDSCQYVDLYATNNTNVNVLCDIGGSCDDADFYVSNSENVNIIADGSCGAHLYAYNTTTTNVLCSRSGSCSGLWINGMGSDTITVNCEVSGSCRVFIFCPTGENSCRLNCKDSGSTIGSCYRSVILFDWEYLTLYERFESSNVLNLSCPSNEYDCADIRFDCEHYNDGSLSMQTPYTKYEWNGFAQAYECATSQCCPIHTDLLCAAGEDCHIQCNDTGSVLCSNAIINAKDATSLTVECVVGECRGAHFQCPSASNTACHITCGNGWGYCGYSHFYSNGATDINIQGTPSLSCRDMQMYITSANNVVNLNCSGDVDFENYGENSTSNIVCLGWNGCSDSSFRFNSSNSIAITCDGAGACDELLIYGGHSGDVTVECNTRAACYRLRLQMTYVDSLALIANVNDTFAGRYGNLPSRIYAPANIENGTQITCADETACSYLEVHVENDFVYGWLDVQCDSPTNVCSDIIVGCYPNTGEGWSHTTLSSSSGEYICNATSQSVLCCPFGAMEITPSPTKVTPGPSTQTQETQGPTQDTQGTQETQETQATNLVSTGVSIKVTHDDGKSDVCSLSVTISILFVILFQIIF